MDANQQDTLDLNGMINDIMREYVQAEEEVHLEPQPEKITNVEPETQLEEEEQAVEERAIVEYIKGQHLYRILVHLAHILLPFFIRISAFDRSRVFGLVQVFQVLCILVIGVRVQRTNVDHCG